MLLEPAGHSIPPYSRHEQQSFDHHATHGVGLLMMAFAMNISANVRCSLSDIGLDTNHNQPDCCQVSSSKLFFCATISHTHVEGSIALVCERLHSLK
jgi:uncharacterized membrane protein